MSRFAGALLLLTLMGSTVWADVIPSQYADSDAGKARQVVAQRLQTLGLSADQASHRVKSLLDDDARYFAANPERVQMAGDEQTSGFPGWAFLEGIAMLGLVAAGGVWRWNVRG